MIDDEIAKQKNEIEVAEEALNKRKEAHKALLHNHKLLKDTVKKNKGEYVIEG